MRSCWATPDGGKQGQSGGGGKGGASTVTPPSGAMLVLTRITILLTVITICSQEIVINSTFSFWFEEFSSSCSEFKPRLLVVISRS